MMVTIFQAHDKLEECFVNFYPQIWRVSPWGIRWSSRERAQIQSERPDGPAYRIHVIPRVPS